jgi:hypothetical protein
MPKIKCLSILAGPDYRGQPGEVIDVPAKDAAELIKAGAATAPDQAESSTEASQPAEAGGGGEGDGEPITSLEKLSIKEVLALIEAGKLTKEQALALEESGKKRPSLLAALK